MSRGGWLRQLVPGLTASVPGHCAAACAAAGTPVTHRNGESGTGRCRGPVEGQEIIILFSLFSLFFDSLGVKLLVFLNQKQEDLTAAVRLVWLHPLERSGRVLDHLCCVWVCGYP